MENILHYVHIWVTDRFYSHGIYQRLRLLSRALVSTGAKGAAAPVNFSPDTTFRLSCLIFPANGQILHPSIEISNLDTTFLSDFSC